MRIKFKQVKGLLCILLVCTVAVFAAGCGKEQQTSSAPLPASEGVSDVSEGNDMLDPENLENSGETGDEVKAESLKPREGKANGIDVSKWQGRIDWKKVKAAGIDFAVIRIGYRGENGIIYKDAYADYNIQQAEKAGVLVGVYFFSTAINTAEAKEEAEWTASAIEGYPISYPVVYDCEGFKNSESRMYSLTNSQRTENALAFLDYVSGKGYDGMLYAAKNELEGSADWDTDRIEAKYKIWVARYTSPAYPETSDPDYSGRYDMWQYTNMGSVPGISGNVDMVVSYFVNQKAEPKNSSKRPSDADAPSEDSKIYSAADDEVTAKIEVNLRDSATTKGKVLGLLKNGTFLKRTGIGSNGWSKLVYNGKTVYAITSYLTTDRGYKPPEEDDGFTPASGQVTAKDETNLRSIPSTSGELIATIKNGQFVTRTGVNPNGWTRLTYNGKTVYAKTSLLTTEVNSSFEQASSSETSGTDIVFTSVNEQVTAKSETNLRTVTSSKEDSTIVYLLKRGEFVTRTGVSNEGWSRLNYNGRTVYAISSYLITQSEYNAAESGGQLETEN